jgi:hypothetical protein
MPGYLGRTDIKLRKQYLKALRKGILRARAKKEKRQILDECCRNTGQARKYAIRKIQPEVDLRLKLTQVSFQLEE